MGIFNNISKLTDKKIQRLDATYDLILGDYAKKSELLNYHSKLTSINMEGHKITSLGDPTEDGDAISRIFLNKRISTANKNLKNEIKNEVNTSIADLVKTNNEKVTDLETKITNGATALSELQKTITNQLKSITDTFTELNKKRYIDRIHI